MSVTADDLRPHTVEEFAAEGEALWFFRNRVGGPKDRAGLGPVVEKSIAHRVRPDTTLEFLVKLSGSWNDHNSWEPVWSLNEACEPWVQYCHAHNSGFEAWELGKCIPPQPPTPRNIFLVILPTVLADNGEKGGFNCLNSRDPAGTSKAVKET